MDARKKTKQDGTQASEKNQPSVLVRHAYSRGEQFFHQRRRWLGFLVLLLLVPLYLSVASNEIGGHPLGGDDLNYLFLAQALVQGQGYVDLYLPGHPPHTKYPPLFPLLLTPWTVLGNHRIFASHLLICVIALTIPFLLAAWVLRQGYSATMAAGILLMSATLPIYYQFLLSILSEIPFMAFGYLALWRMSQFASSARARDFWLITAATVAAVLTRTAGIALAAAIGLELFRRAEFWRRRSLQIPWPALFAGMIVLVFGIWSLRNRLVGGVGLGYFHDFLLKNPYDLDAGYASLQDILARVFSQAQYYLPLSVLQVAWGVIYTEKVYYFSYAGMVFIAVGFLARFSRPDKSAEWFFLFSLLQVIGWPFQEIRFMLPILPLAGFYFIFGVKTILEWLLAKVRVAPAKELASLVALMLMLAIISHQVWKVGRMVRFMHTDRWEPARPLNIVGYGQWSEPVINWAKYIPLPENERQYLTRHFVINRLAAQLVPEGQVILSRKPLTMAWFSGRPSLSFLFTHDVEAQWRYLAQNWVSYIYVIIPGQVRELQKSCPDCFQLLVRAEEGYPALYKLTAYPDQIDTPP